VEVAEAPASWSVTNVRVSGKLRRVERRRSSASRFRLRVRTLAPT
jgi:hypothetical protein